MFVAPVLSRLGLFVAASFLFVGAANAARIDEAALREEGELVVLEITTAPFVIQKRYKSMEGPSVGLGFMLKNLHAAGGKLQLKEAPPLSGGHIGVNPDLPACSAPTELWWFRGGKIEVLEPEADKLSNPGFMCHFNADVTPADRQRMLPTLPGFSTRILIFTAGQTEFVLPKGYGVPVANEETWSFVFQALNHNLDGRHSFRHRVTFYFHRQLGLNTPLKAVTWSTPFVAPPLDGDGSVPSKNCPCCTIPKLAINAPANTAGRFSMPDGRTATGHWVVPLGRSVWSNSARDFAVGFDLDRKLVAAWSHIHPFAEHVTMRAFDQGCTTPREVYKVAIENAAKGVGLVNIEQFTSEAGVAMPASSSYELEVAYNNTSGARQDAMATAGLFMTAPEWRLPTWALEEQKGSLFCGVEPAAGAAGVASAPADDGSRFALFHRLPHFPGEGDPAAKPYRVEMTTAEGKVVFTVNPAWAPKTAAALRPLFEKGLYAGRKFIRYESGFVLQLPEIIPETIDSPADRALLYRLPAEPAANIRHEPGVLSMALWEKHANSATSSFSFLFGNGSHLDGKYTVFAKVENWPEASKVLHALATKFAAGEAPEVQATRILE